MVTVSAITALCPSSELVAATARGRRKRSLHPQPQNCPWGGGGGALGREGPWGSRGGAEAAGDITAGTLAACGGSRQSPTPADAWATATCVAPWGWGRATSVSLVLGTDCVALGTSHCCPCAAGPDPTRRWTGKPCSSLPALLGREAWQGRRARYFPGTCSPWGIVLPAGTPSLPFSSLPTSCSRSFPGHRHLKIARERPQSSLGLSSQQRGLAWPPPAPLQGEAPDPNGVCGQDRGAEGLQTHGAGKSGPERGDKGLEAVPGEAGGGCRRGCSVAPGGTGRPRSRRGRAPAPAPGAERRR